MLPSPEAAPSRGHLALLFVLGLGSVLGRAQSAPQPEPQHVAPARPVQAQLIAPLDLTHLHPGMPFFARVDANWNTPACTLPAGSMVRGHVTSFTRRSRSERNSSLQLSFDRADCKNSRDAVQPFTLVAMVGPVASSAPSGQSGVSEGVPLSNDLPLAIGGNGGIRDSHQASVLTDNFSFPVRSLPPQINPGEVIDIRRTRLDLGAGHEGATIITGLDHDIRLEAGTALILMPRSPETSSATSRPHTAMLSGTTGGGNSLVPDLPSRVVAVVDTPKPPAEPPDVTEVCSTACTVIGKADTDSEPLRSAINSLRLDNLGYLPPSNSELAHFTQDTALTYLDDHHLLCTFDPRHLRHRSGTDEEISRTVRAVLIDTSTFTVQRVFDWHVHDGQYLWKLSSGGILVHLGRELKEFDSTLQPVRTLGLTGRLAWVVLSPLGDHFAVGTVRERYSTSVRQELGEVLAEEPEEDIEVRVYDRDQHPILSASRSSKAPRPVLSEEGELRAEREARNRWKISQVNWQRSPRTLAVAHSACRPSLSAPARGLIFMVGCTSSDARWYRMLRPDGHTLLKGDLPSDQIEPDAQASGAAFAVRTVSAVRPMTLGQPFRPSDLKHERIAIYSVSDGTRLSTITAEDFAAAEHGYALSPDGTQVALVGRSSLRFYQLPQHPR